VHGLSESARTQPLDRLQDPVRTAARWIDREHDDDPEGAVWVADEVADYTRQWMDEDSAYEAAQREALLLAERADLVGAAEVAPDQRTRKAIAFLYGGGPRPARDLERILAPALAVEPDGWLSRHVEARVSGVPPAKEEVGPTDSLPGLGSWLELWDPAWVRCLFLGAALAALATGLARRPGAAGLPPEGSPSLALAVGIFLRGDCLIQLIWLAGGLLGGYADRSLAAGIASDASTWLAPLPLLWLGWRYWLREAHAGGGHSPISLPRSGVLAAAGLTLAALVVDVVVSDGISWLTWQADFESHWSEGIDDAWLWGGILVRSLDAIDYVVWAPLVEELAFRGLLYLGLRQRIGPLAAGVLSATLFAGLHFYTVPGMLVTLWSGLVWAWTLERTGSLWPGVVAHAAYNTVWLAGLWVDLG